MTNPQLSGLTEGRIVHYVLPNGEHRAAMIVRLFPPNPAYVGLANLVVFLDGDNDAFALTTSGNTVQYANAPVTVWKTSVHYDPDKAPYTWHWIERD